MNAKKLRDMIEDTLWNNVSTSSVKVQDFVELEKKAAKLTDIDERNDFRELCLQSIDGHNTNPIIPRYLATLLGRHPVDDRFALTVFDDYYRDKKWEEVDYIGNKILTFNENAFVLKALSECYDAQKLEEKKVSCWEKLIRADHTETDVFYKLAAYYENKGDSISAENCYKRVIQRHINANDLNAVIGIWNKTGNNASYLIQVGSRIAKLMAKEQGILFLFEIAVKADFDINSKIKVYKKILEIDPENKEATDKIVSLYREKYAENKRLEYCLSNTGLLHNYMDSYVAVQKFEKEIEFTEGAFVFHGTWGLGRIKTITQDEMQIMFIRKKEIRTMSCNMAFSSLKILPKQHIMVLKAGAPAQTIKEHILGNTEWGLKMLLNSFSGQATLKQMKAELVPSILSDSEWSSWLVAAKKELSTNPYFSTSDESNDIFILRDTPITFEEKTLQIFSRQKGFFNKYDIVRDFMKKSGSTESEEFAKMISYFEGEEKHFGSTGIASFMILDNLRNKQGMTFINLSTTFDEQYRVVKNNIAEVYREIEDAELRKSLVNFIVASDENWQSVLCSLLHVNPSSYILDNIVSGPKKKMFANILSEAVDNCISDPDFALYFLKNMSYEEFEKAKYSREDIVTAKLQMLISISGKVAHGVDTANNKSRQKQLKDMLFGDQELVKLLQDCDTGCAKRIYSFVNNIPELEDDKQLGIKHFILTNRKDAQAIIGAKTETVSTERMIPKGFLCTKAMFDAKSAELEHIMSVEIPENSKEIGTARDLGDLRENAEYQYAKDKQKNLNFMMNKLTDEIDIAKIIQPEKVDTDYVEFGTKVLFHDNINNEDVTYIVLGPWESNPEKNILNFQAPLGMKIYNMKKGDSKKFEINGVKFDLTVKEIELADFNLV